VKSAAKKVTKKIKAAPHHKSPVKTSAPAKGVRLAAAPKRAAEKAIDKPAKAAMKSAPAATLKPAPRATLKSAPPAPVVKPAAKVVKIKVPAPINGRPVPPASVPTDGKPRKNQAGLSSRELEFFRALLLDKRRELAGDMFSMERDALHASGGSNLSNLPLHMADMGTDNYEQEFTLGLMEKDRKLFKEINHALAKIQDGRYGMCEGTGQPISKARLEAQPWARYSIEYARKLEHGGVGRFLTQDFGRVNDE
jgi:RNA polymerase-binding protein DksA